MALAGRVLFMFSKRCLLNGTLWEKTSLFAVAQDVVVGGRCFTSYAEFSRKYVNSVVVIYRWEAEVLRNPIKNVCFP